MLSSLSRPRSFRALRFLLPAAALALVTAAAPACSSKTAADPTPSLTSPSTRLSPSAFPSVPLPTNLPKCNFPQKVATPSWMPSASALPFPTGTYASQILADTIGYHRAIFVVPGTLQDLARMVVDQWPKHGWQLGRGDSEAGEIEEQFSKQPAVGALKADVAYCSPGYSLMLLIYVPDRSQIQQPSPIPTSSPSGSPLAPSPSPS